MTKGTEMFVAGKEIDKRRKEMTRFAKYW